MLTKYLKYDIIKSDNGTDMCRKGERNEKIFTLASRHSNIFVCLPQQLLGSLRHI